MSAKPPPLPPDPPAVILQDSTAPPPIPLPPIPPPPAAAELSRAIEPPAVVVAPAVAEPSTAIGRTPSALRSPSAVRAPSGLRTPLSTAQTEAAVVPVAAVSSPAVAVAAVSAPAVAAPAIAAVAVPAPGPYAAAPAPAVPAPTLRTFRCPHCRGEIQQPARGSAVFSCSNCIARFDVLEDSQGKRRILLDRTAERPAEPLGLPRGSIRGFVALSMSACCWWLILRGHPVPGSLLTLLLTVIGAYFGFRTGRQQLSERVYDPQAKVDAPLHMPSGSIRRILLLGFLVSGMVLLAREGLFVERFTEFYLILGGLIVGSCVQRVLRGSRPSPAFTAWGHGLALATLGTTLVLAWLLLSGAYLDTSHITLSLLCTLVSFYAGSRT